MTKLERFSVLVVFGLIAGWPCLGQQRPLPGFPVSTSVSADGTSLAVARVAQSGGDVEVWALPQLKLKRRWSWQNGGTIRCVALSADGRFVAAGGSTLRPTKPVEQRLEHDQTGQIIVWEIESGAVVYTIDSGLQIESLAFLPDQPLLVSGGAYLHVHVNFNVADKATGFEIHLWDARTGSHVKEAVRSELWVGIGQFQLSADGSSLLATSCGFTWRSSQFRRYRRAFELMLYDLKTGKTRRRLILAPNHHYFLIGFAKNWIATLEEDVEWISDPSVSPLRIGLWDRSSLKRTREYLAPHAELFDARPSPDGNSLALAKKDTVDWLDPQTVKVTRQAPVIDRPGSIRALFPDTETVLAVSIEKIRIQNLTTGRVDAADSGYKGGVLFEPSRDQRLLFSLSGITSVRFSPDGRTIAAGSDQGEVFAWDLKSAQLLLNARGPHAPIRQLAFLRETTRLLAAGDDGSIYTWSMESGQLLSSLRVSFAATSVVALSQESSYVSAGGPGVGIRELELATGSSREVLNESNVTFSSLCYSPVGRVLAWGRPDGAVDLLDLTTAPERRRLRQAGLSAIRCLAFSPDGTELITGGEDGRIEMRDVKTGQLIKELRAHDGSVTALSFSTKGLLASGGKDRTLKFWRNGRRDASFKGHESSIHALAFSSDGQFIAAATGNRSLCIWSVAKQQLFTVLRPPVRD